MKLWTIQKRSVLDTIDETGVWIPDFSKSDYAPKIPGFQETYDFLLKASNKVNGRDDKGLVFCFMKIVGDEVFPIRDIEDFKTFFNGHMNALGSLYEELLENDVVLLELDVDVRNFYPMIIEFNDWNYLTMGTYLPPYPYTYREELMAAIERGQLSITAFSNSGIAQAHIPAIYSKDIVEAYTF